MQKNALTKAALVALASFGATAALAQSSVTLYGNLDVGVDQVKREAGRQTSALKGTKLNTTRVTPDMSSQSALGFKGTEDMGAGYKAGFVLEGQPLADSGTLSRDGRLFGRQAFVGLTTPVGEVRLGRQYAPIFFSSALVTTERFGGYDLFIEGGLTNNLHVRWDNAVTYSAEYGAFRGQLGYSPNAGVGPKVSVARASTPATSTTGQILGGATAGAEDQSKRGQSYGAFGAYSAYDAVLTAGYSQTSFKGVELDIGPTLAKVANLDKYKVINLGAKYTFTGLGLIVNGAFGRGSYDFIPGSKSALALSPELNIPNKLNISSLVLGTRYNVAPAVAVLGQFSETKFRNGNRGKDTSFMLGAEYAFSKRTTLYSRVGQTKDKGTGPDVILPATGIRETPVFVGTGINPDGKTSSFALGVRHTF